MCSLWWHPSCLLQKKHSLQGIPAKTDTFLRPNSIFFRLHLNAPSTPLGIPYAQIAKKHTPATSPTTQDPHRLQTLPQTSDMQDLKEIMKQLFQQMGNMMNLLTTVTTKLT
jgi:hypothetical protein